MKLLLAGVGSLNQRVGALWQQAGHDVVGLRRSVADPSLDFAQHSVDLAAQTWPDYQADAIVVALSAQTRSLQGYKDAYVEPIKQLAASLANWQHLPKRVLVVSSSRVFGVDDGRLLADAAETSAADPYAAVLLEMEALTDALPCEAAVARLSGIYGPGRDWLLRMALKADVEPPQSNHWTNRIHIDDAAAALVHLLTLEHLDDRYIVSDTEPTPLFTMLDYLRSLQNLPALANHPEVAGGKRLNPERLKASGFAWRYPTARSGGYL